MTRRCSQAVNDEEGQTDKCKKKQHFYLDWNVQTHISLLKRNMRVMSCCFCRMTQIRFFVLDAQSLNHPFISARLAKLFILGTVVEINWPPAALNLAQQRTCAQKCDHICCNLMSLYNVFFFCLWKTQCNLSGMCCFPVFSALFEDLLAPIMTAESMRAFCSEGI